MTSKEYISKLLEKRTEHDEQVEVVKFLDKHKILFFAIPNGTHKTKTSRKLFKDEGLRAGVPDLFIPMARKEYHGLFIEMKRRARTLKNGKKSVSHTEVSHEQRKWLTELDNENYKAVVAYGEDEAIEIITEYFKK